MNSSPFQEEYDERDEEEGHEPEITLSTASLLGLFVGLVLICGVFFGFGYSMGRRSSLSAATNPAKANPPNTSVPSADRKGPAIGTQDAANDVSSGAPNDVPVPEQAPLPSAQTRADAATPDQVVEPLHPSKDSITLPTLERPTPLPAEKRKQQKALATPEQGGPAASSRMPQANTQVMVQVAAVVHQEDADVLVSALRQHGYSAVVRTEPQDKLLHVQVGPFMDRTQAISMEQKLVSDGYAAILKQ
jgi:DedD protein